MSSGGKGGKKNGGSSGFEAHTTDKERITTSIKQDIRAAESMLLEYIVSQNSDVSTAEEIKRQLLDRIKEPVRFISLMMAYSSIRKKFGTHEIEKQLGLFFENEKSVFAAFKKTCAPYAAILDRKTAVISRLHNENKQAQTLLANKDVAIEQLHAQQDHSNQQIEMLSKSLTDKEFEITQLREQLQTMELHQAHMAENEAELHAEVKALQARTIEADEEMNKLLDEKEHVEDQLEHVLPYMQKTETLAADLEARKREIAKLKREKGVNRQKGASDKLADVVYELGPTLDNLMMCANTEELQNLLNDVINALDNAGATIIGEIGQETEYDPKLHHYIGEGKIAGDTLVSIEAVGFTVDGRVIHPAKVNVKEAR